MAEASLLVILVIVVVSAVVIFKVVSSALKAALILIAIAAVMAAVVGSVVVKDVFDLKNGLQSSGGLLLFASDDGKVITSGAFIPGLELNPSGFRPVSAAELKQFNEQFAKGSLENVRGENYLVVIVRESLLTSSLPDLIEIDGQKIGKDAVLAQLEREGPEKRVEVLLGAFGLKLQQDSSFMVSAFKGGELAVYPESPVFRAVKALPEFVLNGIAGKLFSGMAMEG